MLNRALVLDGHDPSECAEGPLVANLLRRCRKLMAVDYLTADRDVLPVDLFGADRSIVWFCGHGTIFRKSKRASLDARYGRVFRRVLTHGQAALIPARLLVLSACHTADYAFKQSYTADMVLSFRGSTRINVILPFVASFMTALTALMRRDRIDVDLVRQCLQWAQGQVPNEHWCFQARE